MFEILSIQITFKTARAGGVVQGELVYGVRRQKREAWHRK